VRDLHEREQGLCRRGADLVWGGSGGGGDVGESGEQGVHGGVPVVGTYPVEWTQGLAARFVGSFRNEFDTP